MFNDYPTSIKGTVSKSILNKITAFLLLQIHIDPIQFLIMNYFIFPFHDLSIIKSMLTHDCYNLNKNYFSVT